MMRKDAGSNRLTRFLPRFDWVGVGGSLDVPGERADGRCH